MLQIFLAVLFYSSLIHTLAELDDGVIEIRSFFNNNLSIGITKRENISLEDYSKQTGKTYPIKIKNVGNDEYELKIKNENLCVYHKYLALCKKTSFNSKKKDRFNFIKIDASSIYRRANQKLNIENEEYYKIKRANDDKCLAKHDIWWLYEVKCSDDDINQIFSFSYLSKKNDKNKKIISDNENDYINSNKSSKSSNSKKIRGRRSIKAKDNYLSRGRKVHDYSSKDQNEDSY